MGDPVEHDLRDRALTRVGLGRGFVVDRGGQAMERAEAVLAAAGENHRPCDRAGGERGRLELACGSRGHHPASRSEIIEGRAGKVLARALERLERRRRGPRRARPQAVAFDAGDREQHQREAGQRGAVPASPTASRGPGRGRRRRGRGGGESERPVFDDQRHDGVGRSSATVRYSTAPRTARAVSAPCHPGTPHRSSVKPLSPGPLAEARANAYARAYVTGCPAQSPRERARTAGPKREGGSSPPLPPQL